MNNLSLETASGNSASSTTNMLSEIAKSIQDASIQNIDGVEKIEISAEPYTIYSIRVTVYPTQK